MGCNEETGSKCMEHYNEVAEELSCGFTHVSYTHLDVYKRQVTARTTAFASEIHFLFFMQTLLYRLLLLEYAENKRL